MEFTTSDLQFAAFLLASGYSLVRTEGTGRRKEFVFDQCPKDIELTYYQDSTQVNPRKLFGAYYDLKQIVFGR